MAGHFPDEKVPSITLLQKARRSARSYLARQFSPTVLSHKSDNHADVFIVEKLMRCMHEFGKVFAVKRQLIKNPDDLNDQSYRELRIILLLNRLEQAGKCPNFVTLCEHFKVTPPFYFPLPPRKLSLPNSQYHVFVLEYADRDLSNFKSLPADKMRSVLFQIVYALHVAQKEYEFVHFDLHSRNVLLQDMPQGISHIGYHDKGTIWYAGHYLCKITDFGLSRARVSPVEVIANTRGHFMGGFVPTVDMQSLASNILSSLTIADWHEMPSVARSRFQSLKKAMYSGVPPAMLIRHSFFHCLTERPPDLHSKSAVLWVSLDGKVENLRSSQLGWPESRMSAPEQNELNWGDGNRDRDTKFESLRLISEAMKHETLGQPKRQRTEHHNNVIPEVPESPPTPPPLPPLTTEEVAMLKVEAVRLGIDNWRLLDLRRKRRRIPSSSSFSWTGQEWVAPALRQRKRKKKTNVTHSVDLHTSKELEYFPGRLEDEDLKPHDITISLEGADTHYSVDVDLGERGNHSSESQMAFHVMTRVQSSVQEPVYWAAVDN